MALEALSILAVRWYAGDGLVQSVRRSWTISSCRFSDRFDANDQFGRTVFAGLTRQHLIGAILDSKRPLVEVAGTPCGMLYSSTPRDCSLTQHRGDIIDLSDSPESEVCRHIRNRFFNTYIRDHLNLGNDKVRSEIRKGNRIVHEPSVGSDPDSILWFLNHSTVSHPTESPSLVSKTIL